MNNAKIVAEKYLIRVGLQQKKKKKKKPKTVLSKGVRFRFGLVELRGFVPQGG